jgi:hypothetical protein
VRLYCLDPKLNHRNQSPEPNQSKHHCCFPNNSQFRPDKWNSLKMTNTRNTARG